MTSTLPGPGARIAATPATPAATPAADSSAAVDAAVDAAVAAAVTAAVDAAEAWRRTPPGARAGCLRAAAAAVRADRDRLAALHVQDTGRLAADALAAVDVAAELLEEAATTGPLAAGRALGGDPAALDVVRVGPRGVVAVITPWNDPYPAAAGLLAAALVTGNTVVHKPSERSARCGAALAGHVARACPDGVLGVLDGGAEVGAALVADPRVAAVAHVGSTMAGRQIAAVAGARGAHLLLENGGNDVLLVDDGVDPAWAARQAATGAFTNAGQLCTAVERIVVHAAVAGPFLDALAAEAAAWRGGDPADPATRLGPLVDARAAREVRAAVDDAVRAGARVVAAGPVPDDERYVPATVLADVPTTCALWTQETFGPVAPVVVEASFDEALDLAAADGYGLAATVLTPSTEHALRAADRLEVGTVTVNAVFGGAPGGSADPRRGSGRGRGYGPDLLAELSVLKVVHLEPVPRSGG